MEYLVIVGFFGLFIDILIGNYYLIYEFYNRGDVFNVLARVGGKFSESWVVMGVMKWVIKVVVYMYVMNVIYWDIKFENVVFIDDGRVKLTDFGFALYLEWFKLFGCLGMMDYMVLEVVCCDKEFWEWYFWLNCVGYGKVVDLWVIGVLAFEFVVGFSSF